MTKNDILLYGALLESDMYADEYSYGSTGEDTELLQKALKKVYGVTEETLEEDILKAEKQMIEDVKELIIEFRNKVSGYLELKYNYK